VAGNGIEAKTAAAIMFQNIDEAVADVENRRQRLQENFEKDIDDFFQSQNFRDCHFRIFSGAVQFADCRQSLHEGKPPGLFLGDDAQYGGRGILDFYLSPMCGMAEGGELAAMASAENFMIFQTERELGFFNGGSRNLPVSFRVQRSGTEESHRLVKV
jgi:hypothetical protein